MPGPAQFSSEIEPQFGNIAACLKTPDIGEKLGSSDVDFLSLNVLDWQLST